jgi:hydrogenase maturation protease
MPQVLILAYGNPLRSDDGVAWRAAEAIQEKFRGSEVEVRCLHQLGPELAESVSRSAAVVFVDASSEGEAGRVRCEPLPNDTAEVNRFGHASSPAAVMSLAAQLYGASTAAFCATIAGQDFSHGESLSGAVEAALPVLVRRIEELVQSFLNS